MTPHLSEDQLLALLHGALAGAARDEAKLHLGLCASCAGALAREAALDEVLWQAHQARSIRTAPVPLARGPAPRKRRRWLAGAVAGGAAALSVAAGSFAPAAAAHEPLGLLAWQNVIFYIPLLVGFLLVLGSLLGGHHHHHADADQGGDHGDGVLAAGHRPGDGHGFFGKALTTLGVGRVPLTVALMIAALLFGGAGLIANTILSSLGVPPWLYGPIALAAALAVTVSLTGASARLLQRIMPATETYLVSRHDFAGCTGKLLVPADGSSGYAQIKDREGNVHNIKCRTTGAAFPRGHDILVVEYDEPSKTCVVDANPIAGGSPV